MRAKIVEPCSSRIRKALSIRNMKQTELCEKSKVSKSSLSEYLSGKHIPNQAKIFVLAKALDVDPVWLWGYDVPMETKKALDDFEITEGEKAFIKLLRRLPASELPIVYEKILTALDGQE